MASKGNKLNARKQEIDGYVFDSKKEGRHYLFLKERLKAGEISDLKIHPRYNLVVNGQKVCGFCPDFEFTENGVKKVHDVKGMKFGVPFQLFRVKVKLFKALYGIDVEVI